MSKVMSGGDFSEWQSLINWEKAKPYLDFALIRAGYGDALSYPDQMDAQYERNYSECKRLGIPVGAYWYLYATTPEGARREAQAFIKAMKGKQFEMPVYCDAEEMSLFMSGRCNEVIEAFLDELEKADFWAGIYIYRSAAQSYLNDRLRNRYAMAVAEYAAQLHYSGQYGVWQNSSTWRVDGISGNVDHDYCYIDYPTMIKEKGKNGFPKPAPKLMYKVIKDTPIVQFEGEAEAGQTRQVYGRKTVDGVQYGRVTANGWISLKDCKQLA